MTPSSLSNVFNPSEEDLTRIKKLVLTSLRSTLVQSLDPRLFLSVFRQEFVLNARECETVKLACGRSVYEGAETLLDMLEKKGSRGYDVLCEVLLNDQTQLHLLTTLGETLTQFKYNFMMCIDAQIKAEELHRKEMECNKQYTQLKYPPQPSTQYLTPGYKPQHRSRSPMEADELPYYPARYPEGRLCPGDQIHHDAFVSSQSVPYYQYQQTVPHSQYSEPVPTGLQYQHYGYMHEPAYTDSASHDIPCGQQGN